MDKKGRLLSIWWFLVLALIAGGIAIGVGIYYNANIDARGLEAEILRDHIKACLIDGGFAHFGLLEDRFDIYNDCGLARNVFMENSNFFFSVRIFDGSDLKKEIYGGQRAFEKDCEIAQNVRAYNYPKCDKTEIYGVSYAGNELKTFKIEINAGSNQKGRVLPLL